ncbi:hypothetical protein RND81_09G138100 [Saponaria officinalis]|uniref:Uncharacterized protein n=1 Tax=Saponaria officinalis TaxID=3572 RepID=A0AAW1IMF0_SAPOF
MAVVLSRNDINCSTTTATTTTTTSSFNRQHQSSLNNRNFMGKFPFTNPNPNPNPNFNNNNNNNINFNHSYSRKQISHQIKNGGVDEFKSDDTPSFNHQNHNSNRRDSSSVDVAGVSFSHYISFDISAHSKADLRKLKSQLMSELDRVRNLSSQIESGDINNTANNNNQIASKRRLSPFPPNNGSNKKQQQQPYVASSHVMKMCGTVLKKLSNQKAGIWFTSPVDAVGMGLHDYHTVIDRPMDLGTIKDRLDKGFYDTPEEFASDVRLTFNNALRYNPKGHEVNTFAGQYLALFERWFPPILAKFDTEKRLHLSQITPKVVEDDVQGSSWSKFPSPEVPKMVNSVKIPESKPPTPPSPVAVTVAVAPEPVAPVAMPVVERSGGGRGRKSEGKLPKPKAKDPNKREMSMEEKHKLGAGLQGLPEEKMVQVIQIIRKRNGNLTQEGDEIELDIEAVDTETLWELDRLVTNYKKMVSKIKRQALMGPQSNNVGDFDDTNQVGMSDMMMVDMSSKAKKGGDVGEEDVDIGDEMPVNNFPPLEIDKDDDKQQGGGSSSSGTSSSSGSDDSSSSDSESGSSSGSDSDVDDAQSRDNESKNFHQ